MAKKKKKKNEESQLKRISENAKREKFIELGNLVMEGKAKRVCYAIDGKVGYFYYTLID